TPAFVDHTHANAVLALTDQPEGEAYCRELYGTRLAFVPYVMPGFGLAQLAAQTFEAHPKAEGMILLKHGIFSWADDARLSYERMIELTDMAAQRLARGARKVFASAAIPAAPPLTELAPLLRGALAETLGEGRFRRFVLEHRTSPEILSFVGGSEVARYSQQ